MLTIGISIRRRNNVLQSSSEFIDANLICQNNAIQCPSIYIYIFNPPLLLVFSCLFSEYFPISHQSPPDTCPELKVTLHFCLLPASVVAGCIVEFQTDDNRFTDSIKCRAPCNCYSFIGTQITRNPIQFGSAMRFNLCKLKCVKYGD